MITKLYHWWDETRSSFWFVPAVIVLGAVGLANEATATVTKMLARRQAPAASS